MAKKKILKKRNGSGKNTWAKMKPGSIQKKSGIDEFGVSKRLRNKQDIMRALTQCLVDDDFEAFQEILEAHLQVVNKDQLIRETNLTKTTLYRVLKKGSNPTIKNVTKVLKALVG